MRIFKFILALIAILFGLVTLLVGSRVLLGAHPGYIVYQSLLIFNTLMGALYVLAGVSILINAKKAVQLAAVIFSLNLIVLTLVFYLFKESSEIVKQGLEPEIIIALESLMAMTFRTSVWLVLLIGFGWVSSKRKLE